MPRNIFVIYFCFILVACSRPKTIIIDGAKQSKQQLDKLDSSEIASYSKWLPGEAPPFYEKWNKTTVIVVKTQKVEKPLQLQRHTLLNFFLDSIDNGADILIVQNGIMIPSPVQKKLRELTPEQLSNVYTMDFNEAKQLYGSVARPTSLIINTYDAEYK